MKGQVSPRSAVPGLSGTQDFQAPGAGLLGQLAVPVFPQSAMCHYSVSTRL